MFFFFVSEFARLVLQPGVSQVLVAVVSALLPRRGDARHFCACAWPQEVRSAREDAGEDPLQRHGQTEGDHSDRQDPFPQVRDHRDRVQLGDRVENTKESRVRIICGEWHHHRGSEALQARVSCQQLTRGEEGQEVLGCLHPLTLQDREGPG